MIYGCILRRAILKPGEPREDGCGGAVANDDELARLNLFRSVDVATVRPHLSGCSVRDLPADEILIQADQPTTTVHLLLSGAVSIHLNSPDNPAIVVLGVGETIGELSLIDKQPTPVFAVAQTACRVLVVNESAMQNWSRAHTRSRSTCSAPSRIDSATTTG